MPEYKCPNIRMMNLFFVFIPFKLNYAPCFLMFAVKHPAEDYGDDDDGSG